MKQRKIVAYLLVVATLLFAGSSFVVPFAGFDPDAFPVPQDNPPAQPAGYAFSIWGVIYIWLIISAVFGALKRPGDGAWAPARLPLLISVSVGAIWLPVAARSPVLATVLIWVMLVTAVWSLCRTRGKDRWLLRAPVALYAGWLAAASCVSLALTGAGYDILFSETAWAIVVSTGATLLAAIGLFTLRDIPEFGAAVAWALIAIALKSAQNSPYVAVLAGLGAMIVGGLSILNATNERA